MDIHYEMLRFESLTMQFSGNLAYQIALVLHLLAPQRESCTHIYKETGKFWYWFVHARTTSTTHVEDLEKEATRDWASWTSTTHTGQPHCWKHMFQFRGKWMVGCVPGSVTVEVMGPDAGWLVCTLKPQHLSTYVIGTPILKWMLHTCTDKPSHFITNPNTSKLAIHRQIHIATASLLKVNTIKQQAARCGIHGSTHLILVRESPANTASRNHIPDAFYSTPSVLEMHAQSWRDLSIGHFLNFSKPFDGPHVQREMIVHYTSDIRNKRCHLLWGMIAY